MSDSELKVLVPMLRRKLDEFSRRGKTREPTYYGWTKQGEIKLEFCSVSYKGLSYLDLYGSLYGFLTSNAVRHLYASQLRSILRDSLEFSGIEASEYISKPAASTSNTKQQSYQPEVDCSRSNYTFYVESNPMCWKSEDCSNLTEEEWCVRMRRKVRDLSRFNETFKQIYQDVVGQESANPLSQDLTPEQCAKFAKLVTERIKTEDTSSFSLKEGGSGERNYFIIPQLASIEECIRALSSCINEKQKYYHSQFFRPPKHILEDEVCYEIAKSMWKVLLPSDRIWFLNLYASTFKVEIVEAFYPILHFAFDWDHGLAMSFVKNNDNVLLVNATEMCKALAEDKNGYFFDSYAAFRMDVPCNLPEKDNVRFRTVRTIQHSFLLFRKTFLDIVVATFYFHVKNVWADYQCTKLLGSNRSSNKPKNKVQKRKNNARRRKMFEPFVPPASPEPEEPPEETVSLFLESTLPLMEMVECGRLIPALACALDCYRNNHMGKPIKYGDLYFSAC